jgi:hypothetical protein
LSGAYGHCEGQSTLSKVLQFKGKFLQKTSSKLTHKISHQCSFQFMAFTLNQSAQSKQVLVVVCLFILPVFSDFCKVVCPMTQVFQEKLIFSLSNFSCKDRRNDLQVCYMLELKLEFLRLFLVHFISEHRQLFDYFNTEAAETVCTRGLASCKYGSIDL